MYNVLLSFLILVLLLVQVVFLAWIPKSRYISLQRWDPPAAMFRFSSWVSYDWSAWPYIDGYERMGMGIRSFRILGFVFDLREKYRAPHRDVFPVSDSAKGL